MLFTALSQIYNACFFPNNIPFAVSICSINPGCKTRPMWCFRNSGSESLGKVGSVVNNSLEALRSSQLISPWWVKIPQKTHVREQDDASLNQQHTKQRKKNFTWHDAQHDSLATSHPAWISSLKVAPVTHCVTTVYGGAAYVESG